jgi:hypothetical protein
MWREAAQAARLRFVALGSAYAWYKLLHCHPTSGTGGFAAGLCCLLVTFGCHAQWSRQLNYNVPGVIHNHHPERSAGRKRIRLSYSSNETIVQQRHIAERANLKLNNLPVFKNSTSAAAIVKTWEEKVRPHVFPRTPNIRPGNPQKQPLIPWSSANSIQKKLNFSLGVTVFLILNHDYHTNVRWWWSCRHCRLTSSMTTTSREPIGLCLGGPKNWERSGWIWMNLKGGCDFQWIWPFVVWQKFFFFFLQFWILRNECIT